MGWNTTSCHLVEVEGIQNGLQDQRTRYQGCCGLASTNQGGLPYIPPKVETTYAFRSAKDEDHHEHSKKSKTADKDTGMGQNQWGITE